MNYLLNILILLLIVSITQISSAQSSILCDRNSNQNFIRFSKGIAPLNHQTLQVLSWNVLKFERPNSFEDLVVLASTADITFIQESMHSSGLEKNFTEKISMDWTFFKSFCKNNGASGVQTGTRFQQLDVEMRKSPAVEPIVKTPKVTGFSTVEIQGKKVLLVNIHGLNANTGKDFEKHMDQAASVIAKFNGPVIWAGDFNTWSPTRTIYLINIAKKMGLQLLIPAVDNRKLKLDHILVRGFKMVSLEILDTYQSSDHFPVRAELEFSPGNH